ncbi:glycosyltransferase family 4 protein, partial [Ruminococcaceae bacterium OttesenSCG-928-A16]|nr:glycosyltransferase family 4 protein [Ruminococcaceae bacterium OttesenSCG-928-A16]
AEKLGVSDYVSITGFVNRKQVLNLLPQFDVFAFPSYSEGMPNAVLEAMGCGLPIVMTDCEGHKELISDNGFVVPLNGPITEDILQSLLKLIKDPALCIKMGQRSREIATQTFTWKNTAAQYLGLLKTMEIKEVE